MIKKKNLSQEDKKAWENFIKDPSNIYDKDNNNQKKSRKERFKFDLHGFTLDDANKKVREILFFCVENKYKELLLITGLTMGEKRSIEKIRKLESEGFDSSLKEEEEYIRMEPLRKADEMRLDLQKKQNYAP